MWWIRRDLRLGDNRALAAALARGGPVTPLFVHDPALLASRAHAGAARRLAFLHGGLGALDRALGARGTRLVVRTGPPAAVLRQIVAETGAAVVVAEEDVSPYARRRDAEVARTVPLELVGGVSVRHPGEILTAEGRPFTIFGAFRRAWLARSLPQRHALLAAPTVLPPSPAPLASEPLPAATPPAEFPPGEDEARRRLAAFVDARGGAIRRYAAARDRIDVAGTSALSPYLRFGMISAREAVVAALEARARGQRAGAEAWLAELLWREFYLAVLWHFPFVLRRAFDRTLRTVRWRDAPHDLRAWQEGRTGYPIVDAAMRQLAATGWMHNRARMIVASFLVKDLLLDWRAGEAWFMRQLVDGDPAANNGGWQWTAGTGPGAAPYFRVFNPLLQARRFDPGGDFVRRWVPELAGMPAPAIHQPWRLSSAEPHPGYPAPIVDHQAARARAGRLRRGPRHDANALTLKLRRT